jgi:hypothetical protein
MLSAASRLRATQVLSSREELLFTGVEERYPVRRLNLKGVCVRRYIGPSLRF